MIFADQYDLFYYNLCNFNKNASLQIHELINEFKYVRDCFTVVITENMRRDSGAEANSNGLAGTWRQQTLELERREVANTPRPSTAPKLVKVSYKCSF
jgi:hypothetical protein